MAVVGLSLILASVVYVVFRRPPFIETLWAIFRRYPSIQQPPSTARPPPSTTSRASSTTATDNSRPAVTESTPNQQVAGSTHKIVIENNDQDPSPQSTPKAAPAAPSSDNVIPSLILSEDTRAMPPPPRPSAATSSRSSAPAPGLMAPPPRSPTLNPLPNGAAITNGSTSLLAAPVGRPSPLPNRSYDRQPGSSTLAPPPTHSTKPAKPSRKVILEPGRSPLDWARLANHPTSDLRNLPPGTPYLRVTPSMLKKQTGRKGKDAWTALNGRVYNISPYLPFHPGGEPELMRCAGRDGTKLFGEIHPWVNYETMLASSMIGLFVEENEAVGGEMDGMD